MIEVDLKLVTPRTIALLLMPALLGMIYVATSRGIAGLYHFSTERQLSRLDKATTNSAKFIKKADQFLHKAVKWDAYNPNILEARGRLEAQRVGELFFWQDGSDMGHRNALEDFKIVASKRPSSPWAWINIALMKSKLGEYDDLLQHSLVRAATLGAWEPLVNVRIAEVALSGWEKLDQKSRQVAGDAIYRGLEQGREMVWEVILRYQSLDKLCATWRQRGAKYCTRKSVGQ